MRKSPLVVAILVAGAAALVAIRGCFPADPVPAAGTVLLDGAPLRGGHIRLVPLSAAYVRGMTTPATSPCGTINDAGRFELKHSDARGSVTSTRWVEVPGARPGWYRVIVSRRVPAATPPAPPPESDPVHPHASPRSPPTVETVPASYTDPRTTPLQVYIPRSGTADLRIELDSAPGD